MKQMTILCMILFPFELLLANFLILFFNQAYYHSVFARLAIATNFTEPGIVDRELNRFFRYILLGKPLDSTFYSPQAIDHLADVRRLIFAAVLLFVLYTSLMIITLVVLLRKKRIREIYQIVQLGSFLTIVGLLVMAVGALGWFDSLFFLFHTMVFTNNLWLFPPDDNLVKLFPNTFFVLFVNRLVVQTLATACIFFVVSIIAKTKLVNH